MEKNNKTDFKEIFYANEQKGKVHLKAWKTVIEMPVFPKMTYRFDRINPKLFVYSVK